MEEPVSWQYTKYIKQQHQPGEGYSTRMINANENCYASHDAGPLSFELVWFPQVAVNAGVQQANNSCKRNKTTYTNRYITIISLLLNISLAIKCLIKPSSSDVPTMLLQA